MPSVDFERLTPIQKKQFLQVRHRGIIRSCHETIVQQLKAALGQPRVNPDGTPAEGVWTVSDLVAVLMHRDDPITPPEMRPMWEAQGLEVGVFVADRMAFSQGIGEWHPEDKPAMHPYMPTSKTLRDAPPPGCFYVAVFDMGMCTVTVIEPEKEKAPPAPAEDPPPAA